MFIYALSIGIYSYIIFALGLLSFLKKEIVLTVSLLFIIFSISVIRSTVCYYLEIAIKLKFQKRYSIIYICLSVLIVQALVNFLGVLGPELSFDALWYHLTLPKLYLSRNEIFYIPGGLLYYSAMPKLTEMLYVAGLAFGSEIFAKFVHFLFGILSLIALYNLSRKFLSKTFSLLALVLFYSNLAVGWMSIAAYIDLARTFLEIMALWGFVEWMQSKKSKWLIQSAVMLGLAVSTKLLAIGSLFIFSILIIIYFLYKKNKIKDLLVGLFIYWIICLLIPLPWFIFSYINTGNPIYPFFTSIYKINFDINLFNPLRFISDVWALFTHSADPISLIYITFLPLVLFFFKRFTLMLKIITIYSLLAIIVWYVTPRTGGGRFIIPYLPALSIVVVGAILELSKVKKFKIVTNFLTILILITALISIIYRGVANSKYIAFITGKESKGEFLKKHLNFSFGDFYDIDNYFKTHIKQNDKVLLYGFHNLYYTDFPFVDSSFIKKADTFNYIAVQNSSIPPRFKNWSRIYNNPITKVSVYSKEGKMWEY